MSEHVISIDSFRVEGIHEDQTTEFKTSIFVDAETRQPGPRQMRVIAAFGVDVSKFMFVAG